MNISDEAVEAAGKALWYPNEHDDTWSTELPTYRDYLRAEARKVLTAAAPHLMAAAWDEGADAGFIHGGGDGGPFANPYITALNCAICGLPTEGSQPHWACEKELLPPYRSAGVGE